MGQRTPNNPTAQLQRWARAVVDCLVDGLVDCTDSASDSGVVAEQASLVAASRVAAELTRDGLPTAGVSAALKQAAAWPELVDLVLPEPPDGWADPGLVGVVHEQAASAEHRTSRGAWYTPRSVVRGLLDLAASNGRERPEFIVDPTCGGGAFLLAGLDFLTGLGWSPSEAVARVAGTDIDPGAVAASRWSIMLWAAAHGVDLDPAEAKVEVGDALVGPPSHWPPNRMVVGNPPFATPLKSGAVPATVESMRNTYPDALGPYSDLSAIHLLAAVHHSSEGSVVAFVQPQSLLAGRDAGSLRRHLGEVAPLRALWACRELVFDASVRACGVVLEVGGEPQDEVVLAARPEVEPTKRLGSAQAPWADLAAQALGAPKLPAWMEKLSTEPRPGEAEGRLGSMASATAGFRDEFYGLVAACREADEVNTNGTPDANAEQNRLLTVGLVDPLIEKWGTSDCKFGGKVWQRPTVDLDALEPKIRAWTERQLVPKLVVATQSRVLEPVIDREGLIVPATPLLSVVAEPEQLDLVAAVLLAPPVTVWAWRRWFGAAMAVDSLKLAAGQIKLLPLPTDESRWRQAAELIAGGGSAKVEEVARLMTEAYGANDAVFDWWQKRYRRLASSKPKERATPPR